MPDRIVRAGILTSDPVNGLSWAAEVFYRRLFSVVDDFGRYDGRSTLLRAHLYPLKIDRVSDADVSKWLTECVAAGVVSVYQVSGRPYLEVVKFGQRVRAETSKWPDPSSPDSKSLTPAVKCQQKTALVVDVSVSEDVGVAPRKPRKQPKVSMPLDFEISERVKNWAVEKGHTRLDEHMESFRAKVQAHGYQYADWDAAFMEAIRTDWAKLGSAPPKPSPKSFGPKAAMRESETPLERSLAYTKQRYERGEFGTGTEAMTAYQAECQKQTQKHRSMQ